MIGKSIEEIRIGDWAEIARTISESDVYIFAGVTGDFNPAHLNESYAQKTAFKGRIAHGMLLAGFISAILGNILPGHGTIYVEQKLRFLAPVIIGSIINVKVEVIEVEVERNRVVLKTTCVNQDGKTVLDGDAIVSPPRKPTE